MKEILSVKDVAEIMQLSERKICSMFRNKELPARKIAGKWITTKDALKKYIEEEQYND